MRLKVINTGNFKLDGGAMFGVLPKVIWNKLNPADQNNLCNWAMRCLLIEDGNRLLLVDTGIGNKQSEKFFSYYYLNGDDSLRKSLNKCGIDFNDITDVILTHLHFDHCGGAVNYNIEKNIFYPAFSKAKYWIHQNHWKHAQNSNAREKASFLNENFLPIEQNGQLEFLTDDMNITENISFFTVDGHTEKMICPIINKGNKKLVYMADLIPSAAHIPINRVMAYDIRPLETMAEKEKFLSKAAEDNYILFFEHDILTECATIQKTEKGFKETAVGKLSDFI
ncbi:MAG: MBL fold metallo-hydrolase [Bacteroidetes bacterium]|nr:MBL fold metallo-hydrolase [Bacteroidota bacterium]